MNDKHQRVIKDVAKFGLEARLATFLDTSSNLRALMYLRDKNIHEFPEITLEQDVTDFIVNYNYLCYTTKTQEIFLIANYSDMSRKQSKKFKITMPNDDYKMYLSGLNLYLKDSQAKFYSLSLANIDPICVDGNNQIKTL